MAMQSSRISRWLIVLAESLLLHGLPVFAAQAASGVDLVAAASIADIDNSDLASPRGNDVYLDLSFNGSPHGLVHFGDRNGELWANAATLRQLGFVLPADVADPVRLNGLPGVQVRYDVRHQNVAITAPLNLLHLPTTLVNAPGTATQSASASQGLLLNYDLYATQGQSNASSLNAFTELRAFNGTSVLSSTALSQTSHSGDWQTHSARLDTTLSTSFPEDMLTLRLGDTLTAALPWSRATRIGGIQLSRNFALQPYRTTTPLPAFLGSATLPSDVELYINGMRQYSGQVPSGPFQLNTIPNISGAGNAQVVLTDAFGRTTTLNFSLYDTQQLLQKGLSDWSVDLGAVRKNYGLRSFDYGSDPAASGTWRYGVSDNLTLETHAEATPGLATVGVGGALLLAQAGVLSGAAAGSSHNGQRGSQLNLGYNWRNDRFNFGVDGTRTHDNYLDVASLYGSAPPSGTGRALVGYSTEHLGSVGLSYLYLRYTGQAATRYASAYWFKSLGRSASLSVSANQNLVDRSQRSVFAGFTWSLDGKASLSTGMQRDSGHTTYTADAQSSTPNDGGVGWRAGLRQGDGQNGGQAEVNYLGRYGRLAAGVSDFGSSRYGYANATGALVFMGGQPFAARRIDDAFAVVSTDGVAGVPVTLENRPIGTTDSKGMLLVAPLNAYQNNQLAIDPMQLSADVRIDRVKTIATPGDRAGTLVRFGITPVRAASILLVDGAGLPLPLGSLVRINAQAGEPALVGFDGVVYLDTLEIRNRLDVQTSTGTCHLNFDYHKNSDGIPQIGPLRCIKETTP
jgi:outer membrane usher protein